MALSLSVRNVNALADGVWRARLTPEDLQILAGQPTRVGPVSVLLLLDKPAFDRTTSTLSFSPSGARVLNLGGSDSAVIVESASTPDDINRSIPPAAVAEGRGGGDAEFIAALPSSLSTFGKQLLETVRATYPGALKYFPKSGKFVETPDNFWTVRIQSRDESFRVTLRGRPDEFVSTGSLQLVPDMTGYSSLKLTSPAQIADLMKILQQVPKKGRRM